MTTQHTPDFWKYEPETRSIRSRPSNYLIARLDDADACTNKRANGCLIAAAPEMLEALQEFSKVFSQAMTTTNWDVFFEQAASNLVYLEKVIAKATAPK